MTINTIVTIVLIVFALAVIGAGLYFYFREKSLEEIRVDTYGKFLEAKHNGRLITGKQKMKWVLSQARLLLPKWAQVLVTDTLLEKVVQGWFEEVEDLLDDGERNGSVKEEEESGNE